MINDHTAFRDPYRVLIGRLLRGQVRMMFIATKTTINFVSTLYMAYCITVYIFIVHDLYSWFGLRSLAPHRTTWLLPRLGVCSMRR